MTQAVDAPDLSGLIELSRNPRLDLKPILLRVQTDLFLAAPIRDRAVLDGFAALATGLVPVVDHDTALTVARKLAPCADTPETVLAILAKRGRPIAESLLSRAARLTPDLIATARAAGADIDAALARRIEPQTEIYNTPEPGAPTPALPAIVPGEPILSDRILEARCDAQTAQALLSDPGCAPADLAPLWLHARAEQRTIIRDAVEATASLRACPPALRGIGAVLTEAAERRDVPTFVAALADGLGLPRDFLQIAPNAAARYDLLTLGLRALDLSEAEAVFVFLTLNDTVARSVERVFALVQLYRTTSRAAARELIGAVLDTALAERAGTGEHRAYLAPDARTPRRAAERSLPRAITVARVRQTG